MTVMDYPWCIRAEFDRVERRFDHVGGVDAGPMTPREVKIGDSQRASTI